MIISPLSKFTFPTTCHGLYGRAEDIISKQLRKQYKEGKLQVYVLVQKFLFTLLSVST